VTRSTEVKTDCQHFGGEEKAIQGDMEPNKSVHHAGAHTHTHTHTQEESTG